MKATIVAIAAGVTLLTCGPDMAEPSKAAAQEVRVLVHNAKNHSAVQGARVFVLDADGREIAASHTDEAGVAYLPALTEKDHPKYLLVDHPAFFLSGMRWQPGLMEYYILATLLTVR